MKNITLLLLISVYTLSSLGIGMKQFYCCGKLKTTTISFIQQSNEKCGKGDKKNGCCKTKFKSLKITDNQISADKISNPGKHFTNLHLFTPTFEVTAITNEPLDIANPSHAPPAHQDIPVYLLNCNFRI